MWCQKAERKLVQTWYNYKQPVKEHFIQYETSQFFKSVGANDFRKAQALPRISFDKVPAQFGKFESPWIVLIPLQRSRRFSPCWWSILIGKEYQLLRPWNPQPTRHLMMRAGALNHSRSNLWTWLSPIWPSIGSNPLPVRLRLAVRRSPPLLGESIKCLLWHWINDFRGPGRRVKAAPLKVRDIHCTYLILCKMDCGRSKRSRFYVLEDPQTKKVHFIWRLYSLSMAICGLLACMARSKWITSFENTAEFFSLLFHETLDT